MTEKELLLDTNYLIALLESKVNEADIELVEDLKQLRAEIAKETAYSL
jgi:hypothetical protein